MGPKQSTAQQSSKRQFKIDHPMFSLAQEVQGKQEQTFIRIQVRLASKQVFDEWYTRVKSFPENQSLMQALSAEYKTEGMCGNSGIAFIDYHDYKYLLSNEIENRKSMSKKLFEQSEMWYLIYTILSAASVYHQQGIKAGDIRPDNIFINEDGQVKVASIDSWPGQQTNYAKSFYEKEITYLSPEEVKDYQFGKIEQSTDKQLAQTFSIGLTLLDAATLSESKSLYSKNFKFNYEKLQHRLENLSKTGYSDLLRLTIEGMCEIDAQFRTSARQIIHWLRPYENFIVNLEDFQPQEIPQKLKMVKQRNLQTKPSSNFSQNTAIQYNNILTTFNPNQQQEGANVFLPSKPVPMNSNSFVQSYPLNMPPGSIYQPQQQIGSNYTQGYTVPTYNPPVYVPPKPYQITSSYINLPSSSIQPTTTFTNPISNNMDIHKITLSKIDQQLQRSRQMFPQ